MPRAKRVGPLQVKIRQLVDGLQAPESRSIQVRVSVVRSASFRKEAHLQSLAVAKTSRAREDQSFIDAASDWQDE